MDVAGRVQESWVLVDWIDKHLEGLKWPSDDRSVIAASCLDVLLEHHRSVVLLIQNGFYGSAFALVRSVFECYVRAIWLHRCATDAEIASFQSDTLARSSLDDIISAIEKVDGFDVGILSAVKNGWWSPMNSFTHCGISQVARRSTESEIRPSYKNAEVEEALRLVDTFAILAVGYIAGGIGDEALKQAVLDRLAGAS